MAAAFSPTVLSLVRDGSDLTLRQVALVLYCAAKHRDLIARQVKSIAEALQIPRPGVVRSVDKLVARGLVERQSLTADRRASVVALTPAGWEFVARVG